MTSMRMSPASDDELLSLPLSPLSLSSSPLSSLVLQPASSQCSHSETRYECASDDHIFPPCRPLTLSGLLSPSVQCAVGKFS